MPSSKSAAMDVAQELEEEGKYVVSRSGARKRVKNHGLDTPWEQKIESGFERQNWNIDDNVYYKQDGLSEEVREFSSTLRAESRSVVSMAVVGDAVADVDRLNGEWGEVVVEVMEEQGWNIDRENGLFYLPATELVTESSLSYYLLNSFKISDGHS